jgi:hypothetical protein
MQEDKLLLRILDFETRETVFWLARPLIFHPQLFSLEKLIPVSHKLTFTLGKNMYRTTNVSNYLGGDNPGYGISSSDNNFIKMASHHFSLL